MATSEQGERAGPAPKVCVRCQQDCSTRPRQRDAQGRYHCQECLSKRPAARTPPAVATAVEEAPEPLAFDLVPTTTKVAAGRPCPDCGSFMSEKTVICVGCGFNAQTGMKVETPKRPKKAKKHGAGKCSNCGYSLRGLETRQCPECGTVNAYEDDKRRRDREESRSVARKAYLQPLMMFIGGLSVVCLITALTSEEPVGSLLLYLTAFAIQVPIGLIVYWICGMIWIGFDAPLHLIALRLLGLYAVTDVVYTLIDLVTLSILALFISCVFYVHMLSEMLDMDIIDAIFVGLFTFIAKVFLGVMIVAYFVSR